MNFKKKILKKNFWKKKKKKKKKKSEEIIKLQLEQNNFEKKYIKLLNEMQETQKKQHDDLKKFSLQTINKAFIIEKANQKAKKRALQQINENDQKKKKCKSSSNTNH